MFNWLGKVVGDVVGSVVGLGAAAIAEVLSLPLAAVKEALAAGCKTYDEIRDHCRR